MPSVLVLGAQGMLGRAVSAQLRAAGLDVRAPAQVWNGTDHYTLSVPVTNVVVGDR